MLSENDKDLLNSSDKEHIQQVNDQMSSRAPRSSQKTDIKSNTANSKHTDLLEQMRQGKPTSNNTIERGDRNYQLVDQLNKTSKNKNEKQIIDILQEEIFSLKNMMEQKDNLLEKMSHVFKEKDTIISHLQNKIHTTTYDGSIYNKHNASLTAKKDFRGRDNRKYSASESDRSLRSLAYIMQKTKAEQMRKTNVKMNEEKECLSHSHTETLSGSSTTSIVAKCYDKSWKQGKMYEPQYDSDHEDQLERDDESQ